VRRLSEISGVGELLDAEVKLYNNALHRTAALLRKNKEQRFEQAQAKESVASTYALRTNRPDPGEEEISKPPRSLTTIEECFENLLYWAHRRWSWY